MKKIIILLLCALFVLSRSTVIARQAVSSEITEITSHKLSKTKLISRVNEIRYMDKSNLTSEQKQVLRKELIEIKQKLAEPFAGIYLSAGAIIIILLVLLIVLR